MEANVIQLRECVTVNLGGQGQAAPYSVRLTDGDLTVNITASVRTGFVTGE